MAGIQIDGVNNKIDFDDDADTSISSSTDDTLVIESGGANIASITAGEFAINEGSADIDFRVESNGNTHMLHVDGGNNNVGIGAAATQAKLHIITNDSGALNDANSDDFMIENTSATGMTIGSSNSGEGHIHFSDSDDADVCAISYFHSSNNLVFRVNTAETLRLGDSMEVSTGGETTPDVTDGGLCLNQGADDNFILTAKSSDVNHGMTDSVETDSFFAMGKRQSAGGALMYCMNSELQALRVIAAAGAENTTKGTTGNAPISLFATSKSSSGFGSIGANANMLVVTNNGNTKFIVDGEGDIHADGSLSAYDNYDDAQLVRAYDLSHGKGVIDSKFDKFVSYNHEKLADMKLVGREEDGTPNHFINVTGMQRLHNGAIWQQYEKHQKLANAMYELAKAAVGEDKANEILEQNDITLLN